MSTPQRTSSAEGSGSGPRRTCAYLIEFRGRLRANFLDGHPWRKLDELEARAAIVTREHGKISNDHVDDVRTGERQIAARYEFRRAVLRGVLHHDNDAFHAGHEIHRPAHPFDHLAGHHPVREVAALRYFHGA